MKNSAQTLGCIFFILLSVSLSAQITIDDISAIPYKSNGSVLFGNDIIVNDQPDQNQRKVALCSAFNGWLYAAVTYKSEAYGTLAVVSVLKSTDNGHTWSIILNGWWAGSGDADFTSVDILVIGNSVENLKFILALVGTSSSTGIGYGFARLFNGETGEFESQLFSHGLCYDISLASDFVYSGDNHYPDNIGALYSTYSNYNDTLVFRSPNNEGLSLNNRKIVSFTSTRYHKVSLAYGRRLSSLSGRYFAAWEEQDDFGTMPGHIYTSHTNPDCNGAFTSPVNLDGLEASNDNMCRFPAIACQYNDVDNDSSNLTEIVLFERYNQSSQKDDAIGYYNLQATITSYFTKLNITDSLHNNLQPDINFNPFDSTFMVTYFDSTSQKLPFLVNNYNLRNPNSWNVISAGYNDSSNLSKPCPKVEITNEPQQGANVWIGKKTNGNGVAMYDYPSSTWTGYYETSYSDNARMIGVYPNPCSNKIKFSFELKKTEKVTINIVNILGQSITTIANQYYSEGIHCISYDIGDYSPGTYLFVFKSGSFFATGKLSIIK